MAVGEVNAVLYARNKRTLRSVNSSHIATDETFVGAFPRIAPAELNISSQKGIRGSFLSGILRSDL